MREDSEAALDALMARLAAGERAAFEPLFRALHPRAVRFARARLKGTTAQDVAQAALLKMFTEAHRFLSGRPVLPWFYAIVANEIRSAQRAARDPRVHAAENEQALASDSHEQTLLARELMRALELAIDTLDDDAAQAIRAQLGEGERPALASATFRKRVSRAYARLRLLLGELR
jgi:RNA polymerase sigma-70 factor (ECF subfamily)